MDYPRILVVDADPAVHETLRSISQGREWELEGTFQPSEALLRAREVPFHLVLANVHMPEITGLDLLDELGRVHPETKVVLMDSDSTPGEIIRALRGEAFGYLPKPLAARAVSDAIRQAVEVSAWRGDIEVISGTPRWLRLSVRCKLQAADRVLQFLREMNRDVSARKRDDVVLALHEVLVNAVEHGAHSDPRKRFGVSYIRTARALIYHIQDPGKGFSIDSVSHAAIRNPPDEPMRHTAIRAEQGFRPGGFGILMVRELVDELMYSEKGNEVLLIKYL